MVVTDSESFIVHFPAGKEIFEVMQMWGTTSGIRNFGGRPWPLNFIAALPRG